VALILSTSAVRTLSYSYMADYSQVVTTPNLYIASNQRIRSIAQKLGMLLMGKKTVTFTSVHYSLSTNLSTDSVDEIGDASA
jgi:hypothetical protein